METFCSDTCSTTYVIAANKRKGTTFARRKGLKNFVSVGRIEDLPRQTGLTVVLVGDDYHHHEDYDLLFAEGGFLFDFRARIYYGAEVPACH